MLSHLRILQASDCIQLIFVLRNEEDVTASTTSCRTSSLEHALSDGFSSNSLTSSFLNISSGSDFEVVVYLSWVLSKTWNTSRFSTSSGALPLAPQQALPVLQILLIFLFTMSEHKQFHTALHMELHFPLAQQWQWARWTHCLATSSSHHSYDSSSDMIAAIFPLSPTTKTFSQPQETIPVFSIPGLSWTPPSTLLQSELQSIHVPLHSPVFCHVVLKPEVA